MKAIRSIGIALLLGSLAYTGWMLWRQAATPDILITNVAARPVHDSAAIAVTLGMVNTGDPDRLLAVASDAGDAALVGVEEGYSLAIPAADTSQLATDGAHIRITGIDAPEDGLLIPVTLTFERAGEMTTRARFGAGLGHAGMGMTITPGEGEPEPTLALTVTEADDGWIVAAETEWFTFSEDQADGPHAPGVGHGHLYVNGLRLQRLYGPEAQIGALPPGDHLVRATLNSNDHRTYAVDGTPVTDTVVVTVR